MATSDAASLGSPAASPAAGYTLVDFNQIAPVPCPCGQARRAFTDEPDFPGTIHRTQITVAAQTHYHRRLTETYYILECGPEAALELDGQRVSVHPGTCVLIRPGVRHRAIGTMTVLIVVMPKFDPDDKRCWCREALCESCRGELSRPVPVVGHRRMAGVLLSIILWRPSVGRPCRCRPMAAVGRQPGPQ